MMYVRPRIVRVERSRAWCDDGVVKRLGSLMGIVWGSDEMVIVAHVIRICFDTLKDPWMIGRVGVRASGAHAVMEGPLRQCP